MKVFRKYIWHFSADPNKAEQWISNKVCALQFDFYDSEQKAKDFLNSITQLKLVGQDLLFVMIFDKIGFYKIIESIPLLK